MRSDICKFQENRLIDRLCLLKVKGEVVEKKRMKSVVGQPERGIVVVKFKTRMIEIPFGASQLEQTEIGEQIWFSPPVPERDSCNCNLFAWLIIGIVASVLAIWVITNYFQERTAVLLSFATAGWISVIVWIRVCSHERNKYLRNLETEINFFDTDGRCAPPPIL